MQHSCPKHMQNIFSKTPKNISQTFGAFQLTLWPEFFCFRTFQYSGQICAPLTHFFTMLHFHTSWKHKKTVLFSDVFRGYRNITFGNYWVKRFYKFLDFLQSLFSPKSNKTTEYIKNTTLFSCETSATWHWTHHGNSKRHAIQSTM